MKKVIYIVFAIFALGLASCSKQDIQPNGTSSNARVPALKSLNTITDETDPGGSTITDPELETEEEAHGVGN